MTERPTLPTGKWLTVDPGEDTGFAVWKADKLLMSGTEKLWPFGDAVTKSLYANYFSDDAIMEFELMGESGYADDLAGIELVVCEDFRIYPWEAKKGTLNWDQVRTARLIGSLTQACRIAGVPFKLQPAAIKERAEAAGAKELFSRPLDENRHANDAIRHGVYFIGLCRGAQPVLEHAQEPSS